MKLSEVIKKYGDFEITDDVVKKIAPEFKPEIGKTYYAVELGGTVVHLTWESNERDLFRLNKRNVYRTKEEAQFALDMYVHLTWESNERDLFRLNKRNVYRTKEEAQFALDMYNFCKERSFTPDWTNENEYKYFLVLNYDKRKAHWCRNTSFCRFTSFCYPTLDAVNEVIHRYTFDELAEYYGRV